MYYLIKNDSQPEPLTVEQVEMLISFNRLEAPDFVESLNEIIKLATLQLNFPLDIPEKKALADLYILKDVLSKIK